MLSEILLRQNPRVIIVALASQAVEKAPAKAIDTSSRGCIRLRCASMGGFCLASLDFGISNPPEIPNFAPVGIVGDRDSQVEGETFDQALHSFYG